MPGSHSGHLTKTVVTGVSTHEGPTYYHHHYGSSYDGCAAMDVEVDVVKSYMFHDANAACTC